MLLVGLTGSGKSELARLLARSAARYAGPDAGLVLIIDPAGSDTTRLPGAVTFHDPHRPTNSKGEDWTRAGIARYVPTDPLDLDAYHQLYRVAWSLRTEAGQPRPVWIWLDEAGIPMPAHGAPAGGRRYVVQGRKRALGQLAAHTRPRDIDKYVVGQAAWWIVFFTPDPDDRAFLAKKAGITVPAFEELHAQLVAAHTGPPGSIPHGFIVIGPGVPPQLCAPLDL